MSAREAKLLPRTPTSGTTKTLVKQGERPLLLDLFCGAGGCSVGYHRAGFDVVGVDIEPHPDYPYEMHVADAMTFPLDGFDAIHASPPCQAFTQAGVIHGNDHHVGGEFIRLADGRDIWQVFRDVKFLGNTRIDPCSRVLKRELMRKWVDEQPSQESYSVHLRRLAEGLEREAQLADDNGLRELTSALVDAMFNARAAAVMLAKEDGA